MFPGKELPRVCLASQVNCLRIHLIWDVDKQLVKVVIGVMVRLEDDLDVVDLLGLDGTLRWDEEERSLLRKIIHACHLGNKLEVDWETTDVCDRERLFGSFINQYI